MNASDNGSARMTESSVGRAGEEGIGLDEHASVWRRGRDWPVMGSRVSSPSSGKKEESNESVDNC